MRQISQQISKFAALTALAGLLSLYSLDCLAMAAADDASMQCCGVGPCHQGNREHDCCKAMPQDSAVYLKSANLNLGSCAAASQVNWIFVITAVAVCHTAEISMQAMEMAHPPPGSVLLTAAILRI